MFRCIAPDLRGYNETSRPSGIENYSVDSIVDDVKCLIECKLILLNYLNLNILGSLVLSKIPLSKIPKDD
jgi:pimeloyl-ACP methyl ester carboxylesterase